MKEEKEIRYSLKAKGTVTDWAKRVDDGEFLGFAMIVFSDDDTASVIAPDAGRWPRDQLQEFLYDCYDALKDWSKQYEH